MFDESQSDALSNEASELVLTKHLRNFEGLYFSDVLPIAELSVHEIDKSPASFQQNENRIVIHPSVAPYTKLCRFLILHELIHSYLFKKSGDPDAEEGERFQAEVNRLWKAGAYRGLL